MKIVAVIPIKLNNERLPGKNTKTLGSKPLLQHELHNLLQIEIIDDIIVYCSNEQICKFIPKGVRYLKRPDYLDLNTSNFTEIFRCFSNDVYADIYVYAHATAPFIKVETMQQCLDAVLSGEYDSAFCASKIQDYLWKNGEPLNFDASDIPRSQDIEPIYRETSGIYVFRRDVFLKYHRRVGMRPFIKEVSFKESIDINTKEDFELAERFI